MHYQSSFGGVYQQSDTTFSETFNISSTIDYVFFERMGRIWRFEIDSTNDYMEWYRMHSIWWFQIKTPDSLIARYWSWIRFAGDFNQENQTFSGKK